MSDVDTCPTPPATGVWWDPAERLASVLLQLRLLGGDVDEDRVAECIAAAGDYINNCLDREIVVDGPPGPPLLTVALDRKAIALYHGIDVDPDGEAGQLSPHKQRWGVA